VPSERDLKEAMSRRAALVRRQTPVARKQLVDLQHELGQLERLAAEGGVSLGQPAAGANAAGGPNERVSGPTLFAQLVHLDHAARREAKQVGDAGDATAASRGAVHTLADGAPSIPLTVFSNGFMLYRGPFRPFGSEEAAPFITQVMGGYLPHELQQRHPGGFTFTLHDRSSQTHADAAADARGRSDGGNAAVRGMADIDGAAALLAPQRPEALLRQLPASVISGDGGVVPVRSEVADLLGVRGQNALHGAAHSTGMPAQDAKAMREARLRRFEGRT
jgi:hypothetical protein